MTKLNSANIKTHGTSQLATQALGTVLVLKERYLYTRQISGIPHSLQIGSLCH